MVGGVVSTLPYYENSYENAIKHLQEAAELGNSRAQIQLAKMLSGWILRSNPFELSNKKNEIPSLPYKKGDKLITMLFDLEKDNLFSNNHIAETLGYKKYWNGEEAVKWYTKAMEQGELEAYYHLAQIYYNGFDGIKANQELSKTLLQFAADQGYQPAIDALKIVNF